MFFVDFPRVGTKYVFEFEVERQPDELALFHRHRRTADQIYPESK
jgi:hypothetical protein